MALRARARAPDGCFRVHAPRRVVCVRACAWCVCVCVQCCNTCDSVRQAYQRKSWAFDSSVVAQCVRSGFVQDLEAQKGEGCNCYGFLEVRPRGGPCAVCVCVCVCVCV